MKKAFTEHNNLADIYGNDVNSKRIALLEAINLTGSISAAAKQLGMSYRSAWEAVNTMNNLWDSPLVIKSPGGSHGGGTRLTSHGLQLIVSFKLIQQEYQRFTKDLRQGMDNFTQFHHKLRRLTMRTSVRNQFQGTIVDIKVGPVNAEVSLAINTTDRIIAIITRESVEHLGLAIDTEAYALIKSSFIVLSAVDMSGKTSARNQLSGSISEIRHGPINTEVIIELTGGKQLTAMITEETIGTLNLEVGSEIFALIKASEVVLGVN